MSHHSHRLLSKIRGTVPKEQRDDLREIWGKNFWVWKVRTQVTIETKRDRETYGWCSKHGGERRDTREDDGT